MSHPAFIITIDTEGDNLWQNHDRITTENARYLPRFQQLCEKYGFKPVYLTNYEMASDPVYVEFAQDVIARGCGEVGMHLHAWNSPPEIPLTDNDWANKPYLIEYPAEVIQQKVDYMTHLLEDTFQTKMVSHRAGRWAMNAFICSCCWRMVIRSIARSRRALIGVVPAVRRRETAVVTTAAIRITPILWTPMIYAVRAPPRCWKCR